MTKRITVGIPAYKAEGHICDCLSSINMQTLREELSVVIAKDNPDDDYEFVRARFPELDITILDCEKNTGPGLARQRCLDAAKTDWITFIDADDVFFTPFVMQEFVDGMIENVIEVQGAFLQQITEPVPGAPKNVHAMPRNDAGHPWVFGRCYNVKFLRQFKIGFSELRAMEDGEINWKIKLSIEGSPMLINIIDSPVYLWKTGSEHSITRIGADEDEDHIPIYNYDLCQWGATEAAIGAVKFARKSNAFNGAIIRFATEIMVGQYFTYVECLARKPVFAEQNLFNAKKFYNECFKDYEHLISEDIIKEMYTIQRAQNGENLVNVVPEITFFDFMDKIKTEEYRGDEEFREIRSRLPKRILELDLISGVLGRDEVGNPNN